MCNLPSSNIVPQISNVRHLLSLGPHAKSKVKHGREEFAIKPRSYPEQLIQAGHAPVCVNVVFKRNRTGQRCGIMADYTGKLYQVLPDTTKDMASCPKLCSGIT